MILRIGSRDPKSIMMMGMAFMVAACQGVGLLIFRLR